MRAFLAKLIGRSIFIALALLLIPLAIQNRQSVTLHYDLLAWLNDTPGNAIVLPLFVLLLLAATLGFLAGWLSSALSHFRRDSARKLTAWRDTRSAAAAEKKKPPVLAHLPDEPVMLEPSDKS